MASYQTEFSLGENVYAIDENKIKRLVVMHIYINGGCEISRIGTIRYRVSYMLGRRDELGFNPVAIYNEEDVFSNKESLLSQLRERSVE